MLYAGCPFRVRGILVAALRRRQVLARAPAMLAVPRPDAADRRKRGPPQGKSQAATAPTVREAEEIPLFFTLIPILALLRNYDQENCGRGAGRADGRAVPRAVLHFPGGKRSRVYRPDRRQCVRYAGGTPPGTARVGFHGPRGRDRPFPFQADPLQLPVQRGEVHARRRAGGSARDSP